MEQSTRVAHQIEGRSWLLEVDEAPADMWPRLTFIDGEVFENGFPVGRYEIGETHLRATYGEQCTLAIEVDAGPAGTHPGEMTTDFREEGVENMIDVVTLIPEALQ